jgi:DNA-binding NtrC family response regulator
MPQIQTLVLIDDDPGVIRALALLLKTMSFNVITFSSPLEAVHRVVQSSDVDLVVTDLRMPELSGDDVVQKVRTYSQSLPVIVMSGHATPNDITRLRQLGASAFIPKPFTPQHFKNALQEIAQSTETPPNKTTFA